jgi:choline dehydrogenase-like flavoprotein
MGTLVDHELRVNSVSGLKAVDASAIPAPITAHLQVTVYALANQVADLIPCS